mgnify:CR=1 FL=1
MNSKNTICLWYDSAALEAATFYAETFPDSAVLAVHRAPGDYPSGKEGDVLTVEFRVMGIPCLGLNGGPAFRHSEAFSFQVATDDQAEEMHAFIRSVIAGKYGEAVADNTSILYGGSCKPSNAKALFAKPNVDGGLIGGAALQADSFMGIVTAFE